MLNCILAMLMSPGIKICFETHICEFHHLFSWFQLEVNELPQISMPKSVLVRPGGSFEVVCTVNGSYKVEFYYQGGYLSEGHDPSVSYVQGSNKFSVSNARYGHGGTVYCFADNVAGMASQTTTVVVWGECGTSSLHYIELKLNSHAVSSLEGEHGLSYLFESSLRTELIISDECDTSSDRYWTHTAPMSFV